MIVAESVLIPHRRKPGAHGCKSAIDFFNERRVILEMGTPPAGRQGMTRRPGAAQLNRTKNFHASMCYNGGPVMTENDYRQDVSQNDVDDNPDSEGKKRFDPGIG